MLVTVKAANQATFYKGHYMIMGLSKRSYRLNVCQESYISII